MTKSDQIEYAIGQLLVAGFEGTTVNDAITGLAARGYLGGAILCGRNVSSLEGVRDLVATLHSIPAPSPLLLAIEDEGVQRLPPPFPSLPPPPVMGRAGRKSLMHAMAGTIARALRVLGFHQSYLPVLDLGGDRSLSDDPSSVARLGAAFVDGLQSDGVAACGKHFPAQREPSVDLIPFRAVVHAEVASIMTPHPVTFSEQLLRRGLGFEGVIVGDQRTIERDLDVVRAIGAGCDQLLLDASWIPLAHAALMAAVELGTLSRDRIFASVARIDRLKTSYVFGRPGPIAGDFVAHLPTSEHASLLAELETGPKVTPLGDGIVEYDFEGDPDETLELDV